MFHSLALFLRNCRSDDESQVISFIHRPTFNPNTAPEMLVLATASIGARFTNLSGAASFANALAELNRRLLLSLVSFPFLPNSRKTTPSFLGRCSRLLEWYYCVL